MRGYVHVEAIGNVGKDPEVRYTQSGKAVASLSLAVNEKRSGEEKTEWVNLVAWEKTAEIISQYVKKGSPLHVAGRLQTRKWQDRNGENRYTTEVIVDRLTLLGSASERQESAGNGAGRAAGNGSGRPEQRDAFPGPEETGEWGGGFDPNDDVPF